MQQTIHVHKHKTRLMLPMEAMSSPQSPSLQNFLDLYQQQKCLTPSHASRAYAVPSPTGRSDPAGATPPPGGEMGESVLRLFQNFALAEQGSSAAAAAAVPAPAPAPGAKLLTPSQLAATNAGGGGGGGARPTTQPPSAVSREQVAAALQRLVHNPAFVELVWQELARGD